MSNDFVLINFDENGQNFSEKDITDINSKINETNPSVIVVCTQKSTATSIFGKAPHFQHIFKEKLDKKYKIFRKNDHNGYRTRVYYNNESVGMHDELKKKIPEYLQKKNIAEYKENNIYFNNDIKNNNTKKNIYRYGFHSEDNFTVIRLVLKDNEGNLFKSIVVNADLSKLSRIPPNDKYTIFRQIIKNSRMSSFFDREYNIFFCGNFDYIFFKKNDMATNYYIRNNSLTNINKLNYGDNYRDELYEYLIYLRKHIGSDLENSKFIYQFQENIKKFGLTNTSNTKSNPSMSSKILVAETYIDGKSSNPKGKYVDLGIKEENFKIISIKNKGNILLLELKMIFIEKIDLNKHIN